MVSICRRMLCFTLFVAALATLPSPSHAGMFGHDWVDVSAPDRSTALILARDILQDMGYKRCYIYDQAKVHLQCSFDVTVHEITEYQHHAGANIERHETGSHDESATLDVLVEESGGNNLRIGFDIHGPRGAGGFDKFAFVAVFQRAAARTFLDRGNNERAVSLYESVHAGSSTEAALRSEYAVALDRSGRHEEALVQYKEALRLAPKVYNYARNVASALCDLRRYDEAVAAYVAISDLGNAGACLMRAGRGEEGLAYYRRWAAMVPTTSVAQYSLGTAAERMGKKDEAIGAFRKAAEMDSFNDAAWAKVGHYELEAGHAQQAVIALGKAIERSGSDPERHFDLGRAWVAQKLRKDIALAEVATLRKLDNKRATELQALIDATSFSGAALGAASIVFARVPEQGDKPIASTEVYGSDYAVNAKLLMDQPASISRRLDVSWRAGTNELMKDTVTLPVGSKEIGFGMTVRGAMGSKSILIEARVLDPAEGGRTVATEKFKMLGNVRSALLQGVGGIGVLLRAPQGAVIVSNFAPESPAQKAGLAEGDVILAVDGTRVGDIGTLDGVTAWIRGNTGTRVALIVQPASGGPEKVFTISRDAVLVPQGTIVTGRTCRWVEKEGQGAFVPTETFYNDDPSVAVCLQFDKPLAAGARFAMDILDPSGKELMRGTFGKPTDSGAVMANVDNNVSGYPWWKWASGFNVVVHMTGSDKPIIRVPFDKAGVSRPAWAR